MLVVFLPKNCIFKKINLFLKNNNLTESNSIMLMKESVTQASYKTDTNTITLDKSVEISSLIVHNDEINTFDYVIASLMDICDMDINQAEQCTIIIHHKGKYSVKSGEHENLRPLKDAFIDRGIGATIE